MRLASSWRAFALAGAVVACAPAPRVAPVPAGQRHADDWLASSGEVQLLAVQMAKLRFDALLAADSVAGARLVAAEGAVHLEHDLFNGPQALQLALQELLRGKSPDGLLLRAGAVTRCTDGLYEYGGTFRVTARVQADGLVPSASGFYEARWVEEEGLPRILRMRLVSSPGARPPHSRAERSRCEELHRQQFAARRWVVRAIPGIAALRGNTIASEVQGALSGDGWTEQLRLAGPYRNVNRSTLQLESGVRRRLGRQWSLELQGTLLPEAARIGGYDRARASHLSLDVRRVRSALLAGVEHGFVHVSAGPNFVFGSVLAKQIGLLNGGVTTGIVDSSRTSIRRVGWMLQTGVTVPASSVLGFELFGQLYTAPMSIPASASVPAFRSDRPVLRGGLALQFGR